MDELSRNSSDNIIRCLVGCKCDLKHIRYVSIEEAEELAKFYNIKYMETSAKENINVDEVFMKLAN